MSGEFDFISWIRQHNLQLGDVQVGIGDDCAVLSPPTEPMLVTTDLLTEGVDFLLAETTPEAIGRKAMAVNLSDIAAMAGIPRYAVVGLVLPADGTRELAERLFLGLRDMANQHGVAIVGGDTNSWQQNSNAGLVISVTVLGEARVSGPILRNGAKPGDELYVTGPLGGSLLGRHLDPKPKLIEARLLVESFQIHAMIDISDGLAADLRHILEESHCGAIVEADGIPVHPDAVRRSQQSGRAALDHALYDGEDFELIVAAAPGQAIPFPKIGVCTESGYLLSINGQLTPMPEGGWQHSLQNCR